MADSGDRGAQRSARTLLTKHGLDISKAQVTVSHGTCSIRGLITAMAGKQIPDVLVEVNRIALLIRQKEGVRNVIVEVNTR